MNSLGILVMNNTDINIDEIDKSSYQSLPFFWLVESLLFAVLDFFVILSCLYMASVFMMTPGYAIGGKLMTPLAIAILTTACWVVYAWHAGLYGIRRPFWDDLYLLMKCLLLAAFLNTIVFLLATEESPKNLLSAWLFIVIACPSARTLVKRILIKFDVWQVPLIVIGSGANASQTVLALRDERLMGYKPIAMVNVEKAENAVRHALVETRTSSFTMPILKDLATAKSLVKKYPHVKFALAVETLLGEENLLLLKHLTSRYQDVLVVPAFRGLPLYSTEFMHCFSHEALFLRVRNNLSNRSAQFIKRAFDISVSAMSLIILSPFFLVVAYLIKKDGGQAFYSHMRVGRNGKMFGCMKFRSMISNSQEILENLLASDPEARAEWAKDQKLKNDPRITPVGKFLRKTSLDELPQLINVLKGEMSLVGPRPVTQDELSRYGEEVAFYLRVTPGLTGLWQVSGRNDTSYETRVALDTWYVQNWSLFNDLVILFKTIKVVIGRDGSY